MIIGATISADGVANPRTGNRIVGIVTRVSRHLCLYFPIWRSEPEVERNRTRLCPAHAAGEKLIVSAETFAVTRRLHQPQRVSIEMTSRWRHAGKWKKRRHWPARSESYRPTLMTGLDFLFRRHDDQQAVDEIRLSCRPRFSTPSLLVEMRHHLADDGQRILDQRSGAPGRWPPPAGA